MTISPVGSPAVHPELLRGEAQRDEVQQGGYPAVLGVLLVTPIHRRLQLLNGVVLLLEGDVLNQGDTSDVKEDAHERELDDGKEPGEEVGVDPNLNIVQYH